MVAGLAPLLAVIINWPEFPFPSDKVIVLAASVKIPSVVYKFGINVGSAKVSSPSVWS